MDSSMLPIAISAILGGGIFKGIEAVVRAITDWREKRNLSTLIGAKTPAEIESVSIATMTAALQSAQTRISSLEAERALDKTYYTGRIIELQDQIQGMRTELLAMEAKLSQMLVETSQHIANRKEVI